MKERKTLLFRETRVNEELQKQGEISSQRTRILSSPTFRDVILLTVRETKVSQSTGEGE